MADYSYYQTCYQGDSIPRADFPRLITRADAQLARYKRIYEVTSPTDDGEDMASCAIADALYFFETEQNAPKSASIGSVSSAAGSVDVSQKAQEAELYRCARLYLEIHRGCG